MPDATEWNDQNHQNLLKEIFHFNSIHFNKIKEKLIIEKKFNYGNI